MFVLNIYFDIVITATLEKDKPFGGILMSLFGNLFDFNGDGKTDFIEEMMGLEILSELEEDEEDDEDFEEE